MATRITVEEKDRCSSRCIHEDKIDRARSAALKENENNCLSQLFKAMGDTTRLKIMFALEREEMCVCDLAVLLGVTESAVSHQLRLLRQLQLVANRREGPILYYRLNDEHVSQLIQLGLEHIRE